MPWYRSGSVAITTGQTTVVGSNTDFAANARVGDAFQGPDGRWYEVVNVSSSVVLSIFPAYQGPSIAGGTYGLAPIQGYVKDSADALRALVAQYGNKIAALGTTGNFDILPIEKGGTGGTSPASARAGLELGSAALRSVGVGAGQVLTVPAFGLGSREAIGGSSIMPDMNRLETSFGVIADATEYRPIPYGVCMNLAFPGNPGTYLGAQLYMSTSPGGVIGFRSGDYSAVGFNIIYHTGNTTRAADGTLKAI